MEVNMFLLDLQSKVPLNEQIKTQIIRLIEAGALKPGDRLPSVRELARENGINPNTAARAYSELEKEGWLLNLPKRGVYVSEQERELPGRSEEIRSVLKQLKDKGVAKEEITEVLDALYKEV